uniref:Uncharacterized protein n=1 Tax=Arundo donax TaxID=35708 RepID=A0A0A9BH01_ARUDO
MKCQCGATHQISPRTDCLWTRQCLHKSSDGEGDGGRWSKSKLLCVFSCILTSISSMSW